jgi:KDO2-lipid IV(A) lauroyltransferase
VLPAIHGRVRDNVRHILGAEAGADEVERVARQQWRNYLRYMRDFAALPHSAASEMDRVFACVDGWEHIDEAMAQARGLVLVSVHFGNWDLAAGALARRYPVNVIVDSFSSSRVDEAINQRRHALGLKVIPIEKAVKRTASALRRNEVVAFLVDKPVEGDEGVQVSFFGEPARIPGGAGYFAARLKAPLIVAFAWRNPDRSFSAKVLPPISTEGDVGAIMQRITTATEQTIREQPEHWFMFRRMWAAEASSPAAAQLEEAVA